MTKFFKASWGAVVIVVTIVVTLLMVSIASTVFFAKDSMSLFQKIFTTGFPLLVIFLSALYTVRGYTLSPKIMQVHRLFWKTTIPLNLLERVEFSPEITRASVRTFGNGGFFSISGKFHNEPLGSYRALATRPQNSVVLYFEHSTLVVTPDEPVEFEKWINTHILEN